MLGGGSINYQVWFRGHRLDYDRWAAAGTRGWDDVLPSFRRSEDHELGASEFHGTGGPVPVTTPMDRPNLDVLTEAQGTRVLLDGTRATGVEYRRGGSTRRVYADSVVLCAGAVRTPQVLMLSGIGPADHLSDLGIAVVHDLPAGRAPALDGQAPPARQAVSGQ
ncbi:GMC family oxidoreductase N-terminal domain-containing protein [Streptomyces sp. NPDC090298]|uniref:GMC family oxidoreductase N-terminal domain-containing protein n=1 Tax=Streptomyces sp. NPDC090298 TaxID=3365959 RepID=UPI0037FCB7D1